MKPCFECDTPFAGDEALCYGCLLNLDERVEGDLDIAVHCNNAYRINVTLSTLPVELRKDASV